MAASRGLGGLGATEGPPITCNWTTAGLVPQFLPWLAILALLALKPNRGWSAWWIWLPLACLVAVCHCVKLASPCAPNEMAGVALGVLLEVPVALAFGLAALWLLAPYLGRGHRFRTFLGILVVLVVFIVFSFAARVGWGLGMEQIISVLDPRQCAATAHAGLAGLPFLVPLVLPAPGLAAAMVLCGLAYRERFRAFRLCLWLFVSLLAVWVAASALVYVLWRIAWPGSLDYGPFLGIGLFLGAFTIAILLPYLILSLASPFFRERLQALLHVKPKAPPAIEARRMEGPVLRFDRPGTGVDSVHGC